MIGYKISPWYLEDNVEIGLILWDNTQAHHFFYQLGHWTIKHSMPTSLIKQMDSFYKIIKWCDNLNLQVLPVFIRPNTQTQIENPSLNCFNLHSFTATENYSKTFSATIDYLEGEHSFFIFNYCSQLSITTDRSFSLHWI